VYRRNPSKNKVAIICGGGSGHEPAHSGLYLRSRNGPMSLTALQPGFVGDGMLNGRCDHMNHWQLSLNKTIVAAVCGNIFASPNPKQVQRALELVDNSQGFVPSLITFA
jgi:dihydroxyacetone kinase